jgi:hypothetical protein
MAKRTPKTIGLTCWPGGDSSFRNRCVSFDIEQKVGESDRDASDRLHREAGEAGWVIGHMEGQGYYACPDHAENLWDPIRLNVGLSPKPSKAATV